MPFLSSPSAFLPQGYGIPHRRYGSIQTSSLLYQGIYVFELLRRLCLPSFPIPLVYGKRPSSSSFCHTGCSITFPSFPSSFQRSKARSRFTRCPLWLMANSNSLLSFLRHWRYICPGGIYKVPRRTTLSVPFSSRRAGSEPLLDHLIVRVLSFPFFPPHQETNNPFFAVPFRRPLCSRFPPPFPSLEYLIRLVLFKITPFIRLLTQSRNPCRCISLPRDSSSRLLWKSSTNRRSLDVGIFFSTIPPLYSVCFFFICGGNNPVASFILHSCSCHLWLP